MNLPFDMKSGDLVWWEPAGEKPANFPATFPVMAATIVSLNKDRGTALIEYMANPSRHLFEKRLVGFNELRWYHDPDITGA